MRTKILGLVAVGLLAGPGLTNAAAILDQSVIPDGEFACFRADDCFWQQEVVVGVAGNLTGLDVFFEEAGEPNSGTLNVWVGSPWHAGPADYSISFSDLLGKSYFDLSPAAITLALGDTFTFGFIPLSGSEYALSANTGTNYIGDSYLRGSPTPWIDLGFNSYMVPTSVPEPASVVLLGLGLTGLGLSRRRKA